MKTPIYIDSCAWNYLHENGINLASELPPDEYEVYITREVEIELASIPDIGLNGNDKLPLKEYIHRTLAERSIKTTSVFGFRTLEVDGTPSKVQVYSGFGQGTFQSKEDRHYYSLPDTKKHLIDKSKSKSGLGRNQADASLAVRAKRAVILTNEGPEKSGPLRTAAQNGGKVVYLNNQVRPSGLSLGQFLADFLAGKIDVVCREPKS